MCLVVCLFVCLFVCLCDYLCSIPQAAIKPQYVDQIPKAVKGSVQMMLDRKDELKVQAKVCADFGKGPFLFHL